MGRIILAAVLALAIFAACGDDEPTGPTTQGGEVDFEVAYNMDWGEGCSHGAGYRFVKQQKIDIIGYDIDKLGELSDMDLWPHCPKDYRIWAKPKRIYLNNGERVDSLYFRAGEAVEFKLRTLDGKARCEITIKNISAESFGEWLVSKFVMRYKIEIY